MPFTLVFANFLWFFLWRIRAYCNTVFLLMCLGSVLWLVSSHSLVFENDPYRYFIDGLQYVQGENPYQVPPADSQWQSQTSEAFQRAAFPEVKTMYPPLVLWMFSLFFRGAGGDLPLFFLLLKCSALLITAGGLFGAHRSGLNRDRGAWKELLFMGLHPFIVFEWYINLHFDVWMAGLLGLLVCSSQKWRAFALGLCGGMKYVFLPLLGLEKPWVPSLNAFSSFGLFLIAFLVPFWLYPYELSPLWENLQFFAKNWEMNSGVFRGLRHIGYFLSGNVGAGVEIAFRLYFSLVVALFLVVYKLVPGHQNRVILFLYFFILISPVCNPWYFSWVFFLVTGSSKQIQTFYYLSISVLPAAYGFFLSAYQKNSLYITLFNSIHIWMWCVPLLLLGHNLWHRSSFKKVV